MYFSGQRQARKHSLKLREKMLYKKCVCSIYKYVHRGGYVFDFQGCVRIFIEKGAKMGKNRF